MKNETLPVDVARRLDEICDRFESQWSNDPHHLIERLLRDAPAELRPLFFEALLELELELRHRRGDEPELFEYLQRFPNDSNLVNRLYSIQFEERSSRLVSPPLSATTQSPLPHFENFETVRCLGKGGMGVVFLAWDTQLNRQVAIKMIRDETWQRSRDVDQFLLEARAMGALHHPNIVSIFSVGRHVLGPYIVMEYVAEGSLANLLSKKLPKENEAVGLMIQIAKAVEYAHGQGIVHRDLNPQNVLLSDGSTPKVADFGLAKWVSEEQKSIENDLVAGTPSYMSPEQTEGSGTVGPRADVYGLGAILYELLTGRPPFRGPSPWITMDQVRNHEAVAPVKLQPSLPIDLDTICLKCLRKNPNDRYQSVSALREDLERYEKGLPILARPSSRLSKLHRWIKRNPALSGMGISILLVILMGLAGTFWQLRRAEAHLTLAIRENELHEKNFTRAQEAVDYLAQLSARLPQTLPARKEMLSTAEKYYRQLVDERAGNTKLNHGWGLTLLRLGQVRADLGLYDQAITAYREGLQIERQILASSPDDQVAQRHIAGIAQNLAGILRFYGPEHQQEMLALQRESVTAWKDISAIDATSYETRLEYSKALFSLSMLLKDTGAIDESKRYADETLNIVHELRQIDPSRVDSFLVQARTLSHQGTFFEAVDNWHESKRLHEEALVCCQTALKQVPDSKAALMEYADLQNNLAIVHKKLGEFNLATTAYSQAIETTEKLLKASPEDANLIQNLSRSCLNSGILAIDTNAFAEAATHFQKAVDLHIHLLKLAPGSQDTQVKLQSRIKHLVAAKMASRDYAGVRTAIELRASVWPESVEQAWIAATEFANCIDQMKEALAADPAAPLPYDDFVKHTVAQLRRVVELSPIKATEIAYAPEFEILRNEAAFQQFMQETKNNTPSSE